MNAQESHALVIEHMAWAREHGRRIAVDLGIKLARQDCEQEAMCALVDAATKWTGDGEFRAWAYTAIRNHLLNVRKHQGRVIVEYASAGVIQELDRQDQEESLSWERHMHTDRWTPCERPRLSPVRS